MLDQLRAMAIFAKTVQVGSFRGAAKALGLSPSVVSHHVSQLETTLHVVLLYRSTRRIALTEDGRKLFEAAQTMIAAAESGLDRIVASARSPSGSLVVTAPAALISGRLIDDLAAFALAFPQVTLTLAFSDVPIDLLGEGVDVAVRAGSLTDSSLRSRKLFAIPRMLIASPAYLATRPRPTTPLDLATWDWIRLRSRRAEATFFGPTGRKVSVAVSSRLIVDQAEAMLQLARRGLGLVMLPVAIAEADVRLGRMIELLPEWRLEAPTVYAVWQAKTPRTSLAMRLVTFLAQRTTRDGAS